MAKKEKFVPVNPDGRPSSYDPKFAEQARKLCLLGFTDDELADFFGKNRDTIFEWKNQFPEFSDAIKAGKSMADGDVASKLFHRAMGYSHEAVKIVADSKTGAVVQVPFTEHYPPDTAAAIFWLKNRQRAKWRDKVEVDNRNFEVPVELSPDQAQEAWRRMTDG